MEGKYDLSYIPASIHHLHVGIIQVYACMFKTHTHSPLYHIPRAATPRGIITVVNSYWQ